jgi:hypothetical protein
MENITISEFEGIAKHIINPAYIRFKFEITTAELETWHRAVSDLPRRAVSDSAEDWVASSPHPPTPADLREGARRKVISRPGDYGLEKVWKAEVEEVNSGPMPSHVKAALRAMVEEAEKLRTQEDLNRKAAANPKRDEETGEIKLDAWGNPYHVKALARKQEERKILTMEERLEKHREWVKEYNEKYWKLKEDGSRVFEPGELSHTAKPVDLGGGNVGTVVTRRDGSTLVTVARKTPYADKVAEEMREKDLRESSGPGKWRA